ncbi:MAG: flagellar hook-basal body complex protein [Verrucomicrobia bacterium]|nr:flagellar hook-basal body complex protein [Verrucomicrobiota bacterium]
MSLIGTLTSGVGAMRSFTKGLEVIGNNIANVNTTGFKSSNVGYSESFSNTLRGAANSSTDTPNQAPIQVGTGVNVSRISGDFNQGALTATGISTDLGVSGNGFFRVLNSVDGSEYATRAGDFRFDDQNYLVNSKGYRVQGLTGGNATTAPATIGSIQFGTPPGTSSLQSYSIDRLGNVVEFYSDGSSATTNKILLQNYRDPAALTRSGDNLFTGFLAAGPVGGAALAATGNEPGLNGLGTIESGSLELSNVDLTAQFANIIATQRSFQASSRLVTISDNILEEIVNLKR